MKAKVLIIRDAEKNISGTTTSVVDGEYVEIDSVEYVNWVNSLKPVVIATFAEIRNHRNKLLAETDWMEVSIQTIPNKEAWLTYRQALRDVPQNFKTPEEVVWPEKPE